MKGYRDNGGGGGGFGARNKTVYDDVFGGPPKFGATTLPPRLEDYTEIFQGFHASRGSSIPVLDLPPPSVDSDDVWFDVQSSKLDYSEVFGGFIGLDFALSYEELFESSKVGDDDSSDEVWTPAQSESLSDESDPHASLEMNQKEPDFEVEKDLLNGMTNDSECVDVLGSTVSNNQVLPSEKEDENFFSLANNDLCASKDFSVAPGKKLNKSLSQPIDSVSDTEIYGNQKDDSVGSRPLLSVSDLNLKTQPSHLPPPSRPPPALTSKKEDSSNFSSKLKTSKSYAFERIKDDYASPFFDVEVDASSSAAADAAAMKDAVEQAQAKLRSAKALMDRKKEGFQSRSKLRQMKVKVNENHEKSSCFESDSSVTRDEVNKETHAEILEPDAGFTELKKNHNVIYKSYEQKEDDEVVQETVGMSQKKEGCLGEPNAAHNTPNDSDESEMYDNLIEIQLQDNDIKTEEEIVTENWLKNDNGRSKGDDDMGPASDVWVDYEVELEEATVKENKEEQKDIEEHDEKELQQPGSPEISLSQSEEEEEDRETISEQDENEKEQTLENSEEILQEDDKLETERDDSVHTIHEVDCNSEENGNLQKESVTQNDGSDNEQMNVKWDEDESITQEDVEVPYVVFQVVDNEILQDKKPCSEKINEQNDSPAVKIEVKNADVIKQAPVVDQNTDTASKVAENRGKEERLQRARELENERLRKLEEERERQIEREKDRMAVDRATLEARDKAFAETRERAAVERATAEFRQRALAEARERLEKACAEARERSLADKAMEGRLRVEKATAEARERAAADKLRQNSLPSDLSRSYSGLRHYQAPSQGVSEGESPQRCKARLERHQRTADRAAKALAEKNMRDLIAQKEQAERHRLAEVLDAEVKRWSSGKQGNLRALLSTLQYDRKRIREFVAQAFGIERGHSPGNHFGDLVIESILGSDSGWQPVPLTEVITTAAVKKAYRKATLCVHPDKLQQRGATIQQKYICEKVFDLLKEAWNKFNSEER